MDILSALAGGVLIGLASVLLMAGNGRIAGVSGIVAGIGRRGENPAFVAGLLLAAPVMRLFGVSSGLAVATGIPLLAAAGLLVGFGARLGSGCTSGHGVSGLARLSPRSMAAVASFMTAAMVTVFVLRRFG